MLFLFKAFFGLVLGVAVVGGAIVYMAVSGNPTASCADGPVTRSPAAEASFNSKWGGFDAALKQGQAATVAFTEDELASRGAGYLAGTGVAARDFEIHLCANQSKGQASLKMDLLGQSVAAVVTGKLDVAGNPPRIVVESLQVGQVPEQIGSLVANQILQAANIQAPSGIREVATTSTTATLKGQR